MARSRCRSLSPRLVLLVSLALAPIASAEGPEPTATALPDEPTGSLTLASACAAALAASPTLAAYSWELRARDAKRLQAGLRLNPSLDVTVEDVLGTERFRGGRQAQTTVQLSQVIELGGKRGARDAVASAQQDVAARDYDVQRLEVVADVTRDFVDLLAAQLEVQVTRRATAMTETMLASVRRRIAAGRSSPLEERYGRIALARRRIDEEHAEHELTVTRRRLAATWGSTAPTFTEAVGDLSKLPALPSFEDLLHRVTGSPEIARWASVERLRAAELALARARRTPSIIAGGGIRRLEGPDAESFVFQLSIPLPIFDRNQGAVAAAESRQRKAASEKRAAEVRLATVLFALYQELLHGETALRSLEGTIVPQARAALAVSEDAFAQGRLSRVELLDAHRTLDEVERERIHVAASAQHLVLGIERLTGHPLHDDGPSED